MCKAFGYNINHHSNGIMLPGYLDLACHLAVPLHKSSHEATITDQKEKMNGIEFLNYPKAVGFKVRELLSDYQDGDLCSNGQDSSRVFNNKMKKVSQFIFVKVKSFKWTLTATGKLFQASHLGCCNKTTLQPQLQASLKEIKCFHREQGTSHVFNDKDDKVLNISKNQINYIKIGY